uniref:caveolin-3-like n=1 Tax=Scatophagus argus TaxID=75038 RepID=UPI001ED84DB1|nr:caveolin-3-like [Scatophagus argus]
MLHFNFSFSPFLQSESRTMDEINEEQPLIRRERPISDIDLNNRDPKEIHNDVVKVNFEDVIAEPDGIHSLALVWKFSYEAFTKSKKYIYCSLTAILGVPLSLIWGLLFASLSFLNFWVVMPCIKCVQFQFYCLIRPLLLALKVVIIPIFVAMGKVASQLKNVLPKRA